MCVHWINDCITITGKQQIEALANPQEVNKAIQMMQNNSNSTDNKTVNNTANAL